MRSTTSLADNWEQFMKLNPALIEYVKTNIVTSIDLEATPQDDDSIQNFAAVLEKNTQINSLYFSESQINDNQLQILSRAIKNNKSLCFIDFSINPAITEKGIEYLTEALKQGSSIQVINLSHITLTPKSIDLLNEAVYESLSIIRLIPEEIMTPKAKK